MTATASLMLAISFFAGLVLRNMGHTAGYQQGYRDSRKHSANVINDFLAWLPAEDRLHYRTKLAEFNSQQLVKVLQALQRPEDEAINE
jgi:hypothetical protein